MNCYFDTQTSDPKTIYCWNTVKIEDPPTEEPNAVKTLTN